MVILGLIFALTGIYTLVFKKFSCINERRVGKFEGTYLLMVGSLSILGEIFSSNERVKNLIIILLMLLYVSLKFLRNKFFELK